MSLPETGVVMCAALWLGFTATLTSAARRRGARIWGSVAWAGLLFALDPLVLGLGLLAALGSLLSLAGAGVATLLAWRRGDSLAKKGGVVRCLLFLETGVLGLALVALNFRVAEERGQRVVDAVLAHRAESGELPATLAELAPRHIEQVPSVRMQPFSQHFLYDRKRAELAYVLGPLMGRIYDFRAGAWRPLDD